jgi:hypothetical protein
VAVKVTAGKEPAVAVRVLVPGVAPSVQLPTVATPEALEVAGEPATVPPPLATANVTLTPFTGFPLASLTVTAGAMTTAVPAAVLCPSPAVIVRLAAVPPPPPLQSGSVGLHTTCAFSQEATSSTAARGLSARPTR